MKTKILSGILLFAALLFVSSCSDDDYLINRDKIVSSITTGNAEVTSISATITGSVDGLAEQSSSSYNVGICISREENPQNGQKVVSSLKDGGDFTAKVTGLTKGVTYFYCSYVTLQNKVTYYGDVKSFTTTDALVGTADAANITAASFTIGGTLNGVNDLITSNSSSLSYGVKVSCDESSVQNGRNFVGKSDANSFTIDINGLLPNKKYYYMAYMSLDGNVVYGDVKECTTETYDMEFVDMGLSVKWASCNLGALKAEETGGMYGWGDVTGLNCSTTSSDYGPSKGNITATDFDICAAAGEGRMPTFAEVNELITKCTQEWTTVNGVSGYKFTARNGNSIFLPAAGERNGDEIENNGSKGMYWTGTANPNFSEYAYTMTFNDSKSSWGTSYRYQGLSIRPVKDIEVEGVKFDNYKLVTGDLEGKGNYRIEIYNAYGSTAKDCGLGVAPADFAYTDEMDITFTLSGITVPGEYEAYLAYADGSWATSNWGYNEDGQGSVIVKGNGTYTIKFKGSGSGLNVFCIDIKGLATACGGAEGITATINSIKLDDWGTKIQFDNYKLVSGDVESKGNYRMEIYNAYGETANDCGLKISPSDFLYKKKFAVTFTLKGITVPGNYETYLAFADGSWASSNWGYNEDGQGSTIVKGDGTYTVKFNGSGSGLNVFCIDVKGLVSACGTDKGIIATIDVIRVE